MNKESIIILSISFLVLLIIIFILYFKLKNIKSSASALTSQLQNLKLQTTYRFEEDIAFLTYMVGFKCKVYTDLVLNPSTELSSTKFLKGEDQEVAIKDIVVSIIHSLSDEYVQILLKYFSVESLQEYITELVLNKITSTITDLNNKKIKNFVRSAIKDTDITFKKKDIE